jgi:hypothetical protein
MSSDIVLSHRRHPICHTMYHKSTDIRVTTDDSNVHTPSQQSNTRSLVRNVQCQRPRPSVVVGHSHVVVNNDIIHSSSSVDVKDSCWAVLEGRVGRGAGGEVMLLLGELEEEEEEGTNNSSHSKEEGTNSSHSKEEGTNNSSHSEEEGINNSSHSKEEGINNSSHSEEEGINSTHYRSNATQRFKKEQTRKTGNGRKILYI